MPKVSVVMPVHNAELYLRASIESILAQTYSDFELVVIDDGSTDTSAQIAQFFAENDSRVIVRSLPKNVGICEAPNEGIRISTGKYIARMDADDIALPNRLSLQINTMDSGEIDVVGSNYVKFNEKWERTTKLPTNPQSVGRTLLYKNCLGAPTVTFSRRAFETAGGYDLRYADGGAEDYDLWLRMLRAFKIANLSSPLVRYRKHPESFSHSAERQSSIAHNSASAVANHFASIYNLGEVSPNNTSEFVASTLLTAVDFSTDLWHKTCMKRWLIRLTRYCIEDLHNRAEIKARLFPMATTKEKLKWRFYFRDIS